MALEPGISGSPEARPPVERPEAGFETPGAERGNGAERERVEQSVEPAHGETQVAAAYVTMAPPSQISKDPVLQRVEQIMEADMKDTYMSLPPAAKARFKKQGEAAAEKIRAMLASAKVNAHKVLKILVSWLRTIPHVNRFFLEQEAKLKTDRIMQYAEKEREGRL